MLKRILIPIMTFLLVVTGCGTSQVSKGIKAVQESKEETISDTMRWFNATYGIVTTRNGGDLNLISGFDKDNPRDVLIIKNSLKQSWGITTKEEAEDTINWLINEGGDNQSLLGEYNEYSLGEYTREELVEAIADMDKADQVYLLGVYDAVQAYGENAIVAWDLSRAMQLLSWSYMTGLYTFEEAMETSYQVAQRLQTTYNSWDDMMKSYFYGFQYWNEDDPEDESSESYKRKQIYLQLKTQENSPYSIAWDMGFKKEW